MSHALIFGCGYSGRAIAAELIAAGWRVSGTTRSDDGAQGLAPVGVEAHVFEGDRPSTSVHRALETATHVIASIAPTADGDPVLAHHTDDLANATKLEWIGYLSTVGVYGDHGGAWVDGTIPPRPVSARSRQRLDAERAWQDLSGRLGVPLQIFRLSGIYGPGRGVIEKLRAGTARRLVKPGQIFNRIHVADIAGAVAAGIAHPEVGGIVNVTDDLPAPPQDVVAYAADLLGVHPPPEIPFETADLTSMARSFYGENKRVANARLKRELGYALRHPTYREGLASLTRGG